MVSWCGHSAELCWGLGAIVNDLGQDGDVDGDLQDAADPELDGSLVDQEVAGFEHVAGQPEHHHLHTVQGGET